MSSRLIRVTTLAFLSTFLSLDAWAYIRALPGLPRAGEEVTIAVGGIWGDSSYPKNPELRRTGSNIEIAMDPHSGGGLSATTPWLYTLDAGELEEGLYSVTATVGGAVLESGTFQVLPNDGTRAVLVPGYTAVPLIGASGSLFASALHATRNHWFSFYPGTGAAPAVVGSGGGRIEALASPPGAPPSGGRVLWVQHGESYQLPDRLRISHTVTSSVNGGEAHFTQLPVADEEELFEGEIAIDGIPVAEAGRFRYTLRVYHLGAAGAGRVTIGVDNGSWRQTGLLLPVQRPDHPDRSYPGYLILSLDDAVAEMAGAAQSGQEFVSVRIYPHTPGLYYGLVTLTENDTARVIPFAP